MTLCFTGVLLTSGTEEFDVLIRNTKIVEGTGLIINEFLNPVFQYPEWLSGLKKEEFLKKLEDPEFRGKIRQLYDDCRMKFSMIHTKADPYWFDCFKVFAFKEEDSIGKTIGELAKQKKIHPLDVIFELVVKDPVPNFRLDTAG